MRAAAAEDVEPDWPAHESLAGELAGAVPPLGARRDLYTGEHEAEVGAWIGRARAAPPDVLRSLVLLLVRRAGDEGGWSQDTTSRIRRVVGRPRFTLDGQDAAYLLRTAAALPDTWAAGDVLACAAQWSAAAGPAGDPLLASAAARAAESVPLRDYVSGRDRAAITAALGRLRTAPRRGAPLDVTMIEPGDCWSAAVLAALASWEGGAGPANQLLHHLARAPARGPARAWLDATAALLADPGARRALRVLLEAAAPGAAPDEVADLAGAGAGLGERNADLLRAAAWAAAAAEEDWQVPLLTAVARRGLGGRQFPPVPGRVPAACVAALGLVGSGAALAALRALHGCAGDAAFRGQVGAALARAGRRAGLGRDEVAERVVPRAGLAPGGERVITACGATARITVGGTGTVATAWRDGPGWSGRVPDGTPSAACHVARAAAREVADVVAAELRRLDGLFGQDRDWPAGLWCELYLEHPVTGPLASELIWVFDAGAGRSLAGLPRPDGLLATLDGLVRRPAAGTVRLWHPVRAGAAEIRAWRGLLDGTGLRQPVAQAHRDTYAPAGADAAATRWDAVAGQLLRYPAAYQELLDRGWSAGYLGPPGVGRCGLSGQAVRRFGTWRVVAVLDHAAVGAGPADLAVQECRTGPLAFHRPGRGRPPLRLGRVPDVVFSEAARDVALIAAATAAGACPARESGSPPHEVR